MNRKFKKNMFYQKMWFVTGGSNGIDVYIYKGQ